MRFICWLLGAIGSPSILLAGTETVISKIYSVGGLTAKPVFIQTTQLDRESAQSFSSKAKIVDGQGRVLMTESVVVKNEALVSQTVEQLQSQESWDLEVQGKRAFYRSFKLGAGEKVLKTQQSVSVGENFLNGPMMEMFIEKNWQSILDGKTLKADFSVLELEKAVSFSFSKLGEGERSGKKVVRVKMAPTNFLISMFVAPFTLEFDKEQKRLVYFKGRTPLKDEKSLDRPFDAEILYEIAN